MDNAGGRQGTEGEGGEANASASFVRRKKRMLLPQALKELDADKKELTLLAPASRRGEVTKLEHVHEAEGHKVFSGVESGRGLNVVITDEGRMTLSVVGDGVVWSVFGHALRENDSK